MAADATLLLHKDSISSAKIHTLSRRVSSVMDRSCFIYKMIAEENDCIRVNNLSWCFYSTPCNFRGPPEKGVRGDVTLKTDKSYCILKQAKHNTSTPATQNFHRSTANSFYLHGLQSTKTPTLPFLQSGFTITHRRVC